MKNRIELIIGLLEEANERIVALGYDEDGIKQLIDKARDYSLELQKGIDDLQE